MARHVFLLSSIFALATWGFAFAQEESDEANVHYENLKVLEPLIGSYHGKAAVEALDVAWEVRTKYSWFGTKNILKEEFTLRGTDSNGGDLDDQEWSEPIINYFVWNQVTKRIELVRPMPWSGGCEIVAVDVIGDGDYELSLLRTTRNPAASGKMSLKVTDAGIETSVMNWISEEGVQLPDFEYLMKKIEDE